MANEKKSVKNLTLSELKKQSKKLNERKTAEVVVGEQIYKFEYDVKFRKTKQYALVDDLVAFLSEGNNRLELLDLATPYTTLLVIKHFTSIEVSDDIDEAIDLLNVLVDLDLLGAIVNELPEDEVVSLYDLLAVTAERMKENISEALKEVESVTERIKNPEVKEAIEENGTKLE